MKLTAIINRIILGLSRLEPAGLSPKAPGTCGSALALLLAPWLFMPLSFGLRIAVLTAVFILGGLAAGKAELILGQKDPGSVVIDELLGQWIALLPFTSLKWWEYALAFALFRIFDILKPWPIRASENWLPGGFGIMLDDAVAGIFALFVMLALRSLINLA